jgi:hypothetical protein
MQQLWHRDTDAVIRAAITTRIEQIIKDECLASGLPAGWQHEKEYSHLLPQRVEARLYEGAESIYAYNEPSTLQDRAIAMYKKLSAGLTPEQVANDVDLPKLTEPVGAETEAQVGASLRGVRSRSDSVGSGAASKRLKADRAGEEEGSSEEEEGGGGPKRSTRRVSAQGCSRVFIIHVLRNVCNFLGGQSVANIFSFKSAVVSQWLSEAKATCQLPLYKTEEAFFGGPSFLLEDPRTYWVDMAQFLTWWKNNIERRQKHRVLVDGAFYQGADMVRSAR